MAEYATQVHGCVVLCLNRAERNAVRVSFAGGAIVVLRRVARLRRCDHPHFCAADDLLVDFRLDLGVAETQRNAGHRKILTAIRPKQSVDLSVIAGYAKLPLGLAVPGFEFIVVDRPITAHAEVRLEFEVVWEKAWGVA